MVSDELAVQVETIRAGIARRRKQAERAHDTKWTAVSDPQTRQHVEHAFWANIAYAAEVAYDGPTAEHIAEHDPASVLARCDDDERLLDRIGARLARHVLVESTYGDDRSAYCPTCHGERDEPCQDHEDARADLDMLTRHYGGAS